MAWLDGFDSARYKMISPLPEPIERRASNDGVLIFCCCARDGAISGATFCTEDIIIMTILITITPKLIVFIFYVSSLLLVRVGI